MNHRDTLYRLSVDARRVGYAWLHRWTLDTHDALVDDSAVQFVIALRWFAGGLAWHALADVLERAV